MRFYIFSFILLFPVLASAQGFNGGILAGGNISQVDGDTWKGYHKIGLLAGGYVYYQFSPNISIQLEMEFIQKGSRHNIDQENPDDQSYLLKLNYVEMPLLFTYNAGRKFSFEAGPAMDVLISYTEEQDGIANPATEPMRDVTLAGILGASYRITERLKVNFRWNYSLISLRDAKAPYPASYRKILFEYGQYNNVLSLAIFWDFKSPVF
jgi:opacity protein-like surface antigen